MARTAAAFENVDKAGQAVTDFIQTGHSLSLLEIMDQACFSAVEKYLGSRLLDDGRTPAAVFFAQTDTGTSIELDACEDRLPPGTVHSCRTKLMMNRKAKCSWATCTACRRHHRYLCTKTGTRLSMKALMPSVWSSVANAA